MFGSKEKGRQVTETSFTWKKNEIHIEGNYLVTKGTLINNRIPLKAIDTVVWAMNPLKPSLVPSLRIIGQGVVLGEIGVGLDIISDVQDWLLEKL